MRTLPLPAQLLARLVVLVQVLLPEDGHDHRRPQALPARTSRRAWHLMPAPGASWKEPREEKSSRRGEPGQPQGTKLGRAGGAIPACGRLQEPGPNLPLPLPHTPPPARHATQPSPPCPAPASASVPARAATHRRRHPHLTAPLRSARGRAGRLTVSGGQWGRACRRPWLRPAEGGTGQVPRWEAGSSLLWRRGDAGRSALLSAGQAPTRGGGRCCLGLSRETVTGSCTISPASCHFSPCPEEAPGWGEEGAGRKARGLSTLFCTRARLYTPM